MKRFTALLMMLAFALAAPAFAQQDPAPAAGQAVVSLYRVAPGQHAAFLKWMAEQEAISIAAGVAPSQWYAHLEGDSWDYVQIGPVTTPEQDKAVEERMRTNGKPTGFKAGLRFRQYVASHTDTIAAGPYSAAQLNDMANR